MSYDRRFQVDDSHSLMDYLCSHLEQNRTAIKKLLKFGAVHVNGESIRQFDHPLNAGDEVTVVKLQAAAATSQLRKANIRPIFEDESIIVVEKPCGLLTVATDHETTDTLFVRLNSFLQQRDGDHSTRAMVVHRLDQETSGLVLFAKQPRVQERLQANWTDVQKVYCAIVQGCPSLEKGTITSHLVEDRKSLKVYSSDQPRPRSRPATTHYRVLKSNGSLSLIEMRLETGRKHQIRVHFASLGCPVVGDRRYGTVLRVCNRLALHASGLDLAHPVTGERLEFSSPLPKSLRKLLS